MIKAFSMKATIETFGDGDGDGAGTDSLYFPTFKQVYNCIELFFLLLCFVAM